MSFPMPFFKMKEIPSSPFASLGSFPVEKEEGVVDDSNAKNNDDENDGYDWYHHERRMERSRSMDDTVSGNDNNNKFFLSTAELESENERLRGELWIVQNKLARVKATLKEQWKDLPSHQSCCTVSGSSPQQQQQHAATLLTSLNGDIITTTTMTTTTCETGGGGVLLLEWPATLRNLAPKKYGVSRMSTDTHHQSPIEILDGNTKDHHSASTTDERSTVETYIDLEAHQSGAGLFHRSSGNGGGDNNNNNNHSNINMKHRKATANITPTLTIKTNPTADDSLSSSNSYEDDEEETEPLVETHDHRLLLPNNRISQHQTKVDGIIMIDQSRSKNNNTNDPLERSFRKAIVDRAGWLVGLLVFQSLSSFILARNQSLLQHHTVIVQFLTMLVGAGGNAGNQASVGVVRGIAVGTIHRSNIRRFLGREFAMGLALSIILGMAGFLRASVFAIPWLETVAITSSLCIIVLISVVTGALLPLGMYLVGIDPAHSSTTIQVIMDITGVVITVYVSSLVLDTDLQQYYGWNWKTSHG
jgi:cation transporter-like permease